MIFDPIGLIDEAYQPQRDARAWLHANALKIVAPIDDTGWGTMHYFIRDFLADPIGAEYQPGVEHSLDPERSISRLMDGLSQASQEQIRRFVLAMQQPGAHSFVKTFGVSRVMRELASVSFRESPAVIIPTGERTVAVVAALTKEPLSLSRNLQALWQHIAIHLGAACRLSGRSDDFGAPDIEAIVDASGKVVEARGRAARKKDVRERLREGVRRRECARARAGRANPLGALALWQALIAGRWSLVDRTDTDGRRFVLARRNEPHPYGPLGLSRRQQQVLFYASVGWSLKQIAYALGLSSEGSVTPHLRAGLNKLGFHSRAELIFATTNVAMQMLASGQAGVAPDALAKAERLDAAMAAAGWSNKQIARRRGVSIHTIANQLTSVYRKTGVRDRYELAAWLSSRRHM